MHHGQFKSKLAVLSTTGRKGRKGFEYDSSAGLEDLLTCVQPSTQGPHLIPWRHPKSIADARKLDRASLLILVATHFIAKAVQWGVSRVVDKMPVLKRHPGTGGDSVGKELGRLAYWLIWLVGLIAATVAGIAMIVTIVEQLPASGI